jgi:tRNA-specific 2-thiouridylase
MRASVKTRYRQTDIPCTLTPMSDGNLKVMFDEAQKAVTPGQSAVFYQGDVCLGGAIIDAYIAIDSQASMVANA